MDGLPPGPFKFSEGRAAGLERWHLESRRFRRLRSGIYCRADDDLGPLAAMAAVARRLPPGAAFSHRSAAYLHGLDGHHPPTIDVTYPKPHPGSRLASVTGHRASLPPDELTALGPLPVTKITRTLLDLSLISSDIETTVAVDSALSLDLVTLDDLSRAAASLMGRRGIRRLRRALAEAEPLSESQMETRLRMLLIRSGLPRPQAQVDIRDADDRFVARVDLYYPAERVAVEYDGRGHTDTLAADAARHNRLLALGIRVLRFTAADVRDQPDETASQVRAALSRAAAA